ncbi:beta-1,4-N-acetylgalactosaminyltransferase bre-4-like [Styela clava]|uniref:beta-1,4-N-acetylgalactosaminyltransferase bre-4-like n=1 Tax=Styela clava TaxID=7725 RepID=UPI00193A79E7|nr:beta-1,4-N-acetylgalactosaminyltransferase bre-4-like [Styela clava]
MSKSLIRISKLDYSRTGMGPSKNTSICLLFCIVTAVYIGIQIIYAAGFLPTKGFLIKVLYTEPSLPPPYIAFLASILTPRTSEMDRPCLWRLFRDRNIMSQLEMMLEDPNRYAELHTFIVANFDVCIIKNDTPANNAQNTSHLSPFPGLQSDESENPPCFRQPADLIFGPTIRLDIDPPTLDGISKNYPQLHPGGYYPGPFYCRKPRHSTVIIIPFRDRKIHLRYFLHYTIGTLIEQQLRFRIIVVEQEGNGTFNKGQLMNTGFNWAVKNTSIKWDCFVFHDVDMIPEIVGNLYKCTDETMILHFSPYIDKFNYTSSPKIGVTVGGAVGFTEWQYKVVNGYSNVYWGWGGEDDDMNVRIRLNGLRRLRPKQPFGRYKMIRHTRDHGNPTNLIRHKLLKSARTRMPLDGLANLETTIMKTILHPTHTRLIVKVNRNTNPPPDIKIPKNQKQTTGKESDSKSSESIKKGQKKSSNSPKKQSMDQRNIVNEIVMVKEKV